ncbi:Serine/threonine-protein kinase [Actinidia chinensis var. chinensis]|uniref:Serine/threonine-protein kinase n=1 Tax=Actinidia chinensis var. chinensis TaxID=1590841 RepID=A0A2R6RRZ5_ACTCC|nr:Serine/threonine-protein kinase [Actinidia chinensis var. chinensis]
MGEARSSGTAVVQNLTGMIQNRVEGMTRPLEKKIERRIEERDKSKERGGDNKRGEKQKDRDREKKSHVKDKDREKEKKKEEKVNKINENKTKDQDKFKNNNKNDHLGTWNIKSSFVSKDGDRNTATEGILKKRKDPEANGFLLDTDVRPNKMPRPNPHPSTENGRKLEPYQNPILFTSDRLGPPNSFKANNNERNINGVIEAQTLLISKKSSSVQIAQAATKPPNHGVIETQPFVCKKSSSFANTQADKIAQASTKPPHPDSKYLSQILSVPKMDEWSDFDDGEWLFSSNDCSAKKPNVGSAEAAEAPRVWAEALQIESSDVCALPYVVPY